MDSPKLSGDLGPDQATKPSSTKQRIILGIDFGTTYSGVAWADSTNPREITPIRQWPDAEGKQDMDKVPSEMAYDANGNFRWGYQACTDEMKKNGHVLDYVKLLLDPSQESDDISDPLGIAKTRTKLPSHKTPVDVVADYLREIKLHALNVLSNQYGTEFWKVIDIEYHLTVPAVWSDHARALTLKAANQAGIGTSQDLVLITEPEAAALYCLTDLAPGLLKKGDTFVIADCGGGTVDLIAYEILEREPKLEVKEVAVGGGLCGSVFLNRKFAAFMQSRLGTSTVEKMFQKGRPYRRMMSEFDEKLKRKFKGSDDQDVMDCPVPGVLDNDDKRIADGFMEIDREEMQKIFDPVIDQILRLIQEQMYSVAKDGHKSVSTIILVGGFGSSKYLYNRVQKHIETSSFEKAANISSSVSVLQPANAWSAVARGAVLCGLQTVDIKSRRARRCYGVPYAAKFDPDNKTHDVRHRKWFPVQEMYKCNGLMEWYIRKGDEISAEKKICFSVSTWRWSPESVLEVSWSLYASNSEGHQAEIYQTKGKTYELCTLKCNLSPLKQHILQSANSSGKVIYGLHYEIVMYIHSAQLTFGIEYEGVPCGATTTVTFD